MYLYYRVNNAPRIKKVKGKKVGIIMSFISAILIGVAVLFAALAIYNRVRVNNYDIVVGTVINHEHLESPVYINDHPFFHVDVSYTYQGEEYQVKYGLTDKFYPDDSNIDVYVIAKNPNDVYLYDPANYYEDSFIPLSLVMVAFSVPCIYMARKGFLSETPEGMKREEQYLLDFLYRCCLDPKSFKDIPDDVITSYELYKESKMNQQNKAPTINPYSTNASNDSVYTRTEPSQEEIKKAQELRESVLDPSTAKEEEPKQYGSRYMKNSASSTTPSKPKSAKKKTDKDMDKYKLQ